MIDLYLVIDLYLAICVLLTLCALNYNVQYHKKSNVIKCAIVLKKVSKDQCQPNVVVRRFWKLSAVGLKV